VLAALFNNSAILALPLIIFSRRQNRLVKVLGGLVLFYALYTALLVKNVNQLVTNYIDALYQSSGAAIRVGLSLILAVLFLVATDRFAFDGLQRGFFRLSSWVTIGLLIALLTTPSSTAVDRIALYMFPLQLAVMGRLPFAFPFSRTGSWWFVTHLRYSWSGSIPQSSLSSGYPTEPISSRRPT
jgi:hypothetical protein